MWAESDTRRDLVDNWLCLARAHSLPQPWSDADDGDASPDDPATGGFRHAVIYGERPIASRGALSSREGVASGGMNMEGMIASGGIDGMRTQALESTSVGSYEDEAQRSNRSYLCPAIEGAPAGVNNAEWGGFNEHGASVLRHLPWLRWVARAVSGAAAEIGLVSLPGDS